MIKKKQERKRSKDSKGRPARSSRPIVFRKKKCKFCFGDKPELSYFNHELLSKFITERGKIIPSRFSGTCAKHQRKLAKAIKRARNAGILPFLAE